MFKYIPSGQQFILIYRLHLGCPWPTRLENRTLSVGRPDSDGLDWSSSLRYISTKGQPGRRYPIILPVNFEFFSLKRKISKTEDFHLLRPIRLVFGNLKVET